MILILFLSFLSPNANQMFNKKTPKESFYFFRLGNMENKMHQTYKKSSLRFYETNFLTAFFSLVQYA